MIVHRLCFAPVAVVFLLAGPKAVQGQAAPRQFLGGGIGDAIAHGVTVDGLPLNVIQESGQDRGPSSRSWWTLWSRRSGHDRIFLGMWTFHPFGDDPYPREANNGLGIQYRSLFGFTCVNSFDQRTWALGIERVWGEARRGPLGGMIGFRVGLIHGYDTELFRVAGETPVLPFAGTVALFRLGPVGGEMSWVYQAVSLVGAIFF